MSEPKKPHKLLATVKAPLIFSLVLGVVAGVVTTFAASGGTGPQITNHAEVREIRFDLGLVAFGIAFIASLVVLAMLSLTYKDNPQELAEGSGVMRRSEDRLAAKKKPAAPATGAEDVQSSDAGVSNDSTEPDDPSSR